MYVATCLQVYPHNSHTCIYFDYRFSDAVSKLSMYKLPNWDQVASRYKKKELYKYFRGIIYLISKGIDRVLANADISLDFSCGTASF